MSGMNDALHDNHRKTGMFQPHEGRFAESHDDNLPTFRDGSREVSLPMFDNRLLGTNHVDALASLSGCGGIHPKTINQHILWHAHLKFVKCDLPWQNHPHSTIGSKWDFIRFYFLPVGLKCGAIFLKSKTYFFNNKYHQNKQYKSITRRCCQVSMIWEQSIECRQRNSRRNSLFFQSLYGGVISLHTFGMSFWT